MKPTVGRVVYFYYVVSGNVKSCAAIVTEAFWNDVVNLVVFTPSMGVSFKNGVQYTDFDLEQNPDMDEKMTMVGKWGWMPYQKTVAATGSK